MPTLAACLTPPGKGAIATIGVRGDDAWTIIRQLFHPRRGELPSEPEEGRFWLGRFGVDQFDDAILAVKAGLPAPSVEVHCHGGIEIVRLMMNAIVQGGARSVSWQEFIDDPLRALLAQAPTERTARILVDQAGGAWKRCVEQNTATDMRLVQRLAELAPLGRHLVTPWKIVFAGAPNVGKSSLMNALAGFTRSIVAPTPGTTRDAVTLQLAMDGWPVEVTDTAGIRASSSVLESQGIERARIAVRHSDLRLWLLDGADTPIFPKDQDLSWLLIINKNDLPPAWDWGRVSDASRISARTGEGMKELCERISHFLVPNPPLPGEAVPVTREQFDWIDNMLGQA